MPKTTLEVMQDHLARADRHDIEGDIAANYAEDCVLLTTYGRFEGHAGVRDAAALLDEQVNAGRWRYLRLDVHDDMAFLEWTGDGTNAAVHDGADTFLIRDGRVRIMTIHYTVVPK